MEYGILWKYQIVTVSMALKITQHLILCMIFVFLVNVPLMYVIASDVIELTLRKWHAYQWHNQEY